MLPLLNNALTFRCSDVTLNMDEDLKTVHVSLPNLCPIDSIDTHGSSL